MTTYQVNFLRAIADGLHNNFASAENRESYHLGSYSNINRLKKALQDLELIEITDTGIYFADPLLEIWFRRHY